MSPQVSVIVPAHNVVRYLPGCIASVLAQTWADFELIVVDDGSTDGTAAVVRAQSDPRVRLVSQANRGLAGARNGGIRAARGELLAFLDADDLWHPEKLERHVRHLRQRPHVGVSYSASALMADDGSDLQLLQKPKLTGIRARDVFLRNPVGNGSAPVIRRQALTDIAFAAPNGTAGEWWYFDESFRQSEDIECWLRMALTTGWAFEGLAQPLTRYRINAGGLSAALDKQLQAWECVVNRIYGIAPRFVERYEHQARAYQLRYLARRAITMGEAGKSLRLQLQALRSYPGMLLHEPARTLTTFGAALAQVLLPRPVQDWSFRLSRHWVGALQRLPRRS